MHRTLTTLVALLVGCAPSDAAPADDSDDVERMCDFSDLPTRADTRTESVEQFGSSGELVLREDPAPGSVEFTVGTNDRCDWGVDEATITAEHSLVERCEEEGHYTCFTFRFEPARRSVVIPVEPRFLPTHEPAHVHYERLDATR